MVLDCALDGGAAPPGTRDRRAGALSAEISSAPRAQVPQLPMAGRLPAVFVFGPSRFRQKNVGVRDEPEHAKCVITVASSPRGRHTRYTDDGIHRCGRGK